LTDRKAGKESVDRLTEIQTLKKTILYLDTNVDRCINVIIILDMLKHISYVSTYI
jgi:hypothetical protein